MARRIRGGTYVGGMLELRAIATSGSRLRAVVENSEGLSDSYARRAWGRY